MSREIDTWSPARTKTFKPELRLTTSASPLVALEVLDLALRQRDYKILDRTAASLRARYIDWFDLISGGINRTVLHLTVQQDVTPERPISTTVVVRARSLDSDQKARKLAAEGLSNALAMLRAQGHAAQATDWYAADRGRTVSTDRSDGSS
jgi:hypothetical protein